MKEKTLLKIALIFSLLGVAALFLLSEEIELEEKTLDKMTSADIGNIVKIKGVVTQVTDTNKTAFLKISQPQDITVILFKDSEIKLETGDYVEIEGSVEEYEGKLEIIGSQVKVIG